MLCLAFLELRRSRFLLIDVANCHGLKQIQFIRLGIQRRYFQVLFSCQPVGHTHSDVDAAFGTIANHLKATDATTLEGLLLAGYWCPC